MINNKINTNNQIEEFNKIKNKILKENNAANLEVILKEEIYDNSKFINNNQKSELNDIRLEKINSLKGGKDFEILNSYINSESLIGNLLDRKYYDKIIDLNSYLTNNQKKQLNDNRKERLIYLSNKYYNNLKNDINISKDVKKLEDKGYYDDRIGEVLENYLQEKTKEDLHVVRRSRLDYLLSESENNTFDILLDLIKDTDDIDELKDGSLIDKDIKELNQTLLTEGRNSFTLDNIRKNYFNNELYNIFKSTIEI